MLDSAQVEFSLENHSAANFNRISLGSEGTDRSREDSPELHPPPGIDDNRQCALCLMYGDDSANVSTLGVRSRLIRTSRDHLSLVSVPDDFNEFVAPRVIFGFVFILRQGLTMSPRLAKNF